MAGGMARLLIFAAPFCCRNSDHAAIMSFVLRPSALEVRRVMPTTVSARIFFIVNGISILNMGGNVGGWGVKPYDFLARAGISTFFSLPGILRYTMCPPALIPYKPKNPKTRLSALLSLEEREQFAAAMLEDVKAVVKDAMCSPVIVCSELYDSEDVQVTIIDADLSGTLNAILPLNVGPTLIIMADLPLADTASVRKVISTQKDIAIVPGRGGGTNVIFMKEPQKFHVDYYGTSFLKHMKIAEEAGLSVEVIDSFRLHTDIDEPEDLVELLIHGTGKSRAYLEELKFSLSVDTGRVRVTRGR
jgi:2-phospho-L-lactate guanylyltransferase